ncbi:hypothetical protein ACFJGV_18415 [Cnuibacter sp. UC19_7]|uniref:hypothetical protein n=1 Tax=Cnuibacter sp. UC19_7 TaxID=3350166 RepID=UPI00366DC6D9
MRFILAILAFIIATALIGYGVAQRTFFLPPSTVESTVQTGDGVAYAVIDSDALRSHEGAQTLTVSSGNGGTVFAAYGRTADVEAWLQGSAYDRISTGDQGQGLVIESVAADPDGAENVASGSADPAASDLWLERFSSEGTLYRTLNLPEGYSVILASNGTDPAPAEVKISWPVSNATPWVGPTLVAGLVFLLVGIVLLILGLIHMRRSHGPRRKPPALPKGKRFSSSRTNAIESSVTRRRRSIKAPMAVGIPVALASALVLSGCSPDYWPQPAAAPTAVATDDATPAPTAVPDDATPEPVVTSEQFASILADVSSVAAEADAAANRDLLTSRFEGPALDLRAATYAIRAAYPEYAAPQAIPSTPVQVLLPQATDSWPRTAFAIVGGDDPSVPPVALFLTQDTPRADYKVYYEIALEPNTTLPEVAAATVGTTRLGPESKLLALTPDQIKTAYSDILLNGDASQYAAQIDPTGDTLRSQVGADYKNTTKTTLSATAAIEFASVAAAGDSIALATSDSGALVAVDIGETTTVKPVQAGATIKPEGAVKALSNVTETGKGTEATYDYQLLFYVPPQGTPGAKAQLLGFTQGLLSAKELP